MFFFITWDQLTLSFCVVDQPYFVQFDFFVFCLNESKKVFFRSEKSIGCFLEALSANKSRHIFHFPSFCNTKASCKIVVCAEMYKIATVKKEHCVCALWLCANHSWTSLGLVTVHTEQKKGFLSKFIQLHIR